MALISNPDVLASFHKGSAATQDYYKKMAEDLAVSYQEALQIDATCVYWFWLHWGQLRSHNSQEDIEEFAQTIGKFYQLPAMIYCWDKGPFGKALLEDKSGEFVDESIATEMAKGRIIIGLFSGSMSEKGCRPSRNLWVYIRLLTLYLEQDYGNRHPEGYFGP